MIRFSLSIAHESQIDMKWANNRRFLTGVSR
jgi:hypothetical protein